MKPTRAGRSSHSIGVAATLVLLACAGRQQPVAKPAPDPIAAVDEPDAGKAPRTDASTRGRTRKVSTREQRAIQSLIDAAERVRGLRFTSDVPVLVKDPNAIMGYVDSQIKQDELERSTTIYVALGLLKPDLDVRKLLLRLMGEQIVGYYDVEAHHLVVREDVMRAFGGATDKAGVDLAEARVVLVHELVHALQDQHLGLSAHIDQERDSDADTAFRAMIEGDATLAMIAFALEREAVPLSDLTRNPARVHSLSELVRGSPLAGSELGSAPAIIRVPLLSAYVDGLNFAANLHGDGGWGRLDRAHEDPPALTEQILHPERYARRDVPERLKLPSARDALGKEYELLHEDTLGELEMGVYFRLGSAVAVAERAADGWGGDRLYAYRSEAGKIAIVWISAWDDEQQATEAERASQRALTSMPGAERSKQLVARSGRALLLLRAVPTSLHDGLRQRFERWASGLQPSTHDNSSTGQSQTD